MVYALGVDQLTWDEIKHWDLSALGVTRVLVQTDLYALEFESIEKRNAFEMCMLMNGVEVSPQSVQTKDYSYLSVN